jgi:hypothetical protein
MKKRKKTHRQIQYEISRRHVDKEKEQAFKEHIQERLNETFTDFKYAKEFEAQPKPSKQGRYLTDEQKAQIIELSQTHYVKDIARIMGLSHTCVIENQQKLVENPKRKTVRSGAFTNERKEQRRKHKEGYFNMDEFLKEMLLD